MKKLILYIVILISSMQLLHAQPDPAKRQEKIQALYIAYITQQLKLSSGEAEKFWPVHAQYDNELKALSPDMDELSRQQATLNIKKKYQDQFTRILGAARTNDFFKTDMEFRAKMIERLRKIRQGGMQKQQRNMMFKRLN